jgi:hypothetical protein
LRSGWSYPIWRIFSWIDVPGDIRSYGALIGAVAGAYAKFSHLL